MYHLEHGKNAHPDHHQKRDKYEGCHSIPQPGSARKIMHCPKNLLISFNSLQNKPNCKSLHPEHLVCGGATLGKSTMDQYADAHHDHHIANQWMNTCHPGARHGVVPVGPPRSPICCGALGKSSNWCANWTNRKFTKRPNKEAGVFMILCAFVHDFPKNLIRIQRCLDLSCIESLVQIPYIPILKIQLHTSIYQKCMHLSAMELPLPKKQSQTKWSHLSQNLSSQTRNRCERSHCDCRGFGCCPNTLVAAH